MSFFEKQIRTGGINMKFKLIMMTVSLISLALAGCSSTATNNATNANMRNLNVANNTAIVVPKDTNTSNTNRWNPKISKEEYEKNRAEYEKEKKGDTWGQSVEDSWLWFKVRSALMTTADLRESTIDVDVNKDVVTLKGTVATKEQMAKAAEVAKVDGVTKVNNQLKVAPSDSITNTGGPSNSKTSNANTKK